MAYNKPIEIKVTSQNTNGTEVNAVRLLDTIEKQLKTVLKEGDLFKSPKASVDYNTHDVTKSFFVRSGSEKIARDVINLQKDNFYKEPSITSNEARTRRYKVDVEGERALAALRADTEALGGRVYGNQHGKYVEIPSYKGTRKDAIGRAEGLTNKLRIKKADEEEKQRQKEERQKEKETEKEERQKEAAQKQHSMALIAGLSSSVMLLKKLISLVENIVTSVIEQGQKSFETSMTAQKLNMSPDILRKIEYAGIAKGIGSAPVNAMLSLQDSFGSTLLAAKNINKLDSIMPLIGADVKQLILNGLVGTNPLGMKTMLMDKFLEAYHAKSNGLGGTVKTKEASLASLITLASNALGEDFATEFNRAAMDNATDYSAWLMDAMPASTPSYNLIQASSDNYEQYNKALAGFQAALETFRMLLFPVLDEVKKALNSLTVWLMKITGDRDGIESLNKNTYEKAVEAKKRNSEENEKFESVVYDYVLQNKDKFGGEEAAKKALMLYATSGIGVIPEHLENDEEGLTDFFSAALAYLVSMYLRGNTRKSDIAIDEYKSDARYRLGEKELKFNEDSLSQIMVRAQQFVVSKVQDYYASRVKNEQPYIVEVEKPYTEEEEAEVREAFGSTYANDYLSSRQLLAEKEAALQLKGIKRKDKKRLKTEIEELKAKLRPYEENLRLHRDFGTRFSHPLDEVEDDSHLFGLSILNQDKAKEFVSEFIEQLVVQATLAGHQLPANYSYELSRDPSHTNTLYIQILDGKGNKYGEPIEVQENSASMLNELIPFYLQGD